MTASLRAGEKCGLDIIHLDLDAFCASVKTLDSRAAGSRSSSAEAKEGASSTRLPEARKFGVHSAQPMATAKRLPGGSSCLCG